MNDIEKKMENDHLFIKHSEEILRVLKDVKQHGMYVLDEKNLKMITYGFYILGQNKGLDYANKELNRAMGK